MQLATVSGVAQANISAIEHGRRVPSATTLHRLLDACGFELTAAAGAQVVVCPPPADDPWLDDLMAAPTGEEPPVVTRDIPMATRVQVLVAVLDASEAIVRAR